MRTLERLPFETDEERAKRCLREYKRISMKAPCKQGCKLKMKEIDTSWGNLYLKQAMSFLGIQAPLPLVKRYLAYHALLDDEDYWLALANFGN